MTRSKPTLRKKNFELREQGRVLTQGAPGSTEDRWLRQSASLALGLRFSAAVSTTLSRESELPLTGKRVVARHEKFVELRAVPVNGFPNYIIYYLPSDELIYLLRVLHGARNLPRLLGID